MHHCVYCTSSLAHLLYKANKAVDPWPFQFYRSITTHQAICYQIAARYPPSLLLAIWQLWIKYSMISAVRTGSWYSRAVLPWHKRAGWPNWNNFHWTIQSDSLDVPCNLFQKRSIHHCQCCIWRIQTLMEHDCALVCILAVQVWKTTHTAANNLDFICQWQPGSACKRTVWISR